jgi:hypothetical protein
MFDAATVVFVVVIVEAAAVAFETTIEWRLLPQIREAADNEFILPLFVLALSVVEKILGIDIVDMFGLTWVL